MCPYVDNERKKRVKKVNKRHRVIKRLSLSHEGTLYIEQLSEEKDKKFFFIFYIEKMFFF